MLKPPLPKDPSFNCVGFDPGGATGVVIYRQGKLIASNSTGVEGMLNKCSDDSFWLLPRIWVVEEFRIYPWKAKDLSFDECISAHVIGMLKVAAKRCGAEMVMQSAQNAKGFSTDDRLKLYDWYEFLSTKHERDAARHVMHYLFKGPKF